jgi:dethiobiotin synthetase
MNQGVFVTGTDTGCGKTRVSLALIEQLRARGVRVGGFKPVAAGSERHDGELRNDDAMALIAASGLDVSYRAANPYCFEPAIAPHLAAEEAGIKIEAGPILAARDELASRCEFLVVEGAGGWRVPLGPPRFDMQALALELGLPVLLVVGLRLGCLNHALLSEQSILASGARLLGWIGSQVDPGMARLNENIATLDAGLSRSCLGILAHPGSDKALTRAVPLEIDYLVSEAVRA